MVVTKRLVCLANSRKSSGRCIAGIELVREQPRAWIRPVSDGGGGAVAQADYHCADGYDPGVLDILEVPLLAPAQLEHQVENWLLAPGERWIRSGRAAWQDLEGLVSTAQPLWLDGSNPSRHCRNDRVLFAGSERLVDSLRLVHVEDLRVHVLAPDAIFGDNSRRLLASFTHLETSYCLNVTDPVAETAYLGKPLGTYDVGNCYLTVSLSQKFSHDGYCYKLVAAVVTREVARNLA